MKNVMKNVIQNKLHSQTGASLLIALLFFLTALTVGAVVLTAAATNAGRLERSRQEQQNYLAVASAARLVQADLRETVFMAGYTKTVTETTDEDGATYSRTEYKPIASELTGGQLLQNQPTNVLEQLYFADCGVPELNEPAPRPDNMRYALELAADNLPDVSGRLAVEPDSALTVELYRQTGDGTRANAMTLRFTPDVKPPREERTAAFYGATRIYTTTYITEITWADCTVTKGAAS